MNFRYLRTRRVLVSVVGVTLIAGATATAAEAATSTGGKTSASRSQQQLSQLEQAARHKHRRPTIVFVHGAWANGSGFDAEMDFFRNLGYSVTAAPNPLRGLTADGDYVRARLQSIPGPIVLVGHSYGGAVITKAAQGLSKVKALVYLAGWGLDTGESTSTLAKRFPGSHIGPNSFQTVPVADPYAPHGKTTDEYIKPSQFANIFAGDVSKADVARQAETQEPQAQYAGVSPLTGPPAWKTIPSWYLMTTNDHAITPRDQHFMATRMKASVRHVYSSHDVMISHPQACDIIVLQAILGIRDRK